MPNRPETTRRPSCRRRWLFRVLAVILGLSVFAGAEIVCIVFDWGRPTNYDDPFVGFSSIHPLFILDESGTSYDISKSRRNFFAAESFPATKRPETFRIFCLGGSTVQGRPYSIETSLTTWLDLSLQAADTSRDWEVINCGGVSYASYRLAPILQECLNYQPDLFVICTGHNEFLEERTYEKIMHASSVHALPQRWLARLRSYVLLRAALLGMTSSMRGPARNQVSILKDDADALLDYKDGLEAYHRDETWRDGVIEHFTHNLRRMISLCRDADVPLILMQPASNLSDCPPFKSEHRDDLTERALQEWESLLKQAQAVYSSDMQQSIELINRAVEIDDQHAAGFYELGKCYEAIGLREQARTAFVRARELDICPLRILEPMEQALARVAGEGGIPLIDLQELLTRECPGGILGNHMLVDHIHPNFRGHQLIADALVRKIIERGWAVPAPDWAVKRTALYDCHFKSLGDFYFLRGERALKNLRGWTQGRAVAIRANEGIESQPP